MESLRGAADETLKVELYLIINTSFAPGESLVISCLLVSPTDLYAVNHQPCNPIGSRLYRDGVGLLLSRDWIPTKLNLVYVIVPVQSSVFDLPLKLSVR